MLTKCAECQKDVSSEASSCPHCGFPLKSQPKDKDVPLVRESNSSKAGLGTFFIVLGIIGIVIGFVAIQPSDIEKLDEQGLQMAQQSAKDSQAMNNYIVASGGADHSSGAQEFRQDADNWNTKLQDSQSSRHIKAACFFIPAGILFVLGLVLRSSAKPSS
jgi:DNA-directed RNA polymerase subunit RPC12/RpoP